MPVYSPAFAGTKLYCLVTEAHRCEKLAQSFYVVVPRRASNPRLLDRESDTLPQHHDATHHECVVICRCLSSVACMCLPGAACISSSSVLFVLIRLSVSWELQSHDVNFIPGLSFCLYFLEKYRLPTVPPNYVKLSLLCFCLCHLRLLPLASCLMYALKWASANFVDSWCPFRRSFGCVLLLNQIFWKPCTVQQYTTPIYLINLLWKLELELGLDSELHYFSIFHGK